MIIPALKEARARGVTIRIALDPSVRQAYDKLAEMADVVRDRIYHKPGDQNYDRR